MAENSSRREFLRTVSLAGVAVVAGSATGCAGSKPSGETAPITGGTTKISPSHSTPPKACAHVDPEGYVVIDDPDLARMLDRAWHDQQRAVKDLVGDRQGIRLKYTVESTDCPGGHVVNNLCGCRPGGLITESTDTGGTTSVPIGTVSPTSTPTE